MKQYEELAVRGKGYKHTKLGILLGGGGVYGSGINMDNIGVFGSNNIPIPSDISIYTNQD